MDTSFSTLLTFPVKEYVSIYFPSITIKHILSALVVIAFLGPRTCI